MRRVRSLLLLSAGLLSAALGACVDGRSPTGLGAPGPAAALALAPILPGGDGAASAAAQGIEGVRVTVTAVPGGQEVARVSTAVDPGAESWSVELEVPLSGQPGTAYRVDVELLGAAGAVQWSGRAGPLPLSPGVAPTVLTVEVGRGPLDNLAVTELSVDGPRIAPEGSAFTLEAVVATSEPGAEPTVFWSSLDPEVATVDADGRGMARRPGTARIQAEAGPLRVVHPVRVTPVPTALVVEPPETTLESVGAVAQLVAAVLDRSGVPIPDAEVSWSVADRRILEALGEGRFRAVAGGRTGVTATSVQDPGLSASAVIHVELAPARVVVEPETVTLDRVGQTAPLAARVLDGAGVALFGVEVAWSSSDPAVAGVGPDGVVTALGAGVADIVAEAGGIRGSARVTVRIQVATVTVTPPSTTLSPGDELTLAAEARDAGGTAVPATFSWRSSDPGVATVSDGGVVHARNPGTAVITASAGGAEGTARVSVLPPPGPRDATFRTAGNTELVTGGFPRPATAHVHDARSALAATPGLVVRSTGRRATAEGGTVEMEPDGDFSYVPPLGFRGTDRFDYEVQGGGSATVRVGVGAMVWYLGAGGEGSGRSDAWLPEAGGALGAPGDVLFVYGGGPGSLPGGFELLEGQRLVGEGEGLALPGLGTLLPAGATPRVGGEGPGVVLARDTEVRGIDLVGTGDGIRGVGVGGVVVARVRVLGARGHGVSLEDPSGTVSFTGLRVDGAAGDGLRIQGGDADLSVELAGPVGISGAAGHLVRVERAAGGTIRIRGGKLVSNGGLGLSVVESTADVDVEAPATLTGAAGAALIVERSTGDVHLARLDAEADGWSGVRIRDGGGVVRVDAGTLEVRGAPGVVVEDAELRASFDGVEVRASPARALDLTGFTGSLEIGDGTLEASAGAAIAMVGGSGSLSYGGTVMDPGAEALLARDVTGGSVTLSGPVRSGAGGIVLDGSTGTAFTFSGTLTLSGAGPGLRATAGGSLAITGPGSTLSTTGPAVFIEDVEIAPPGVVFQSVSADGGTTGIHVSGTGSRAAFAVAGTGAPGSGGTIRDPTGDGIFLSQTSDPFLRDLLVEGAGGHALSGVDLQHFTFDGLRLAHAAGAGIHLEDVRGSGLVTGVELDGNGAPSRFSVASDRLGLDLLGTAVSGTTVGPGRAQLELEARGAGELQATLDRVEVTGSAGDGIAVRTTEAGTAQVTVSRSDARTDGEAALLADARQASSLQIAVRDGTFQGGAAGVRFSTLGTALLTAEVTEASLSGLSGDGLRMEAGEGATLDARVFGNTVPGSTPGTGMVGAVGGAAELRGWIHGNDIAASGGGIELTAGATAGSAASAALTLADDAADPAGSGPVFSVLQAQAASVCLSATGMETTGTGGAGMELRQEVGATRPFVLERLGAGSAAFDDPAPVEAHLRAENPGVPSPTVSVATAFQGAASGTCALPRVPAGARNAPPAAHPGVVRTDGSTPVDLVLTGVDPDPGSTLTFSVAVPPALGSLGPITPLGPGSARVTYTPAGTDADSFVFQVDDGSATGRALVRIEGPSSSGGGG